MRPWLLAASLTLGSVAPAQASRSLRFALSDCGAWPAAELERLAQLELATVGGGESDVGSADVHVKCGAETAVITATDPRTRRSLSRSVAVSEGAEGAERLLAISVAQLVRALDWLPEAPTAKPTSPAAKPVSPAPRPAPHRALELQLGVGPRSRAFSPSLVTYRVALGSGFALSPSLRLGAGISYESGETARATGRVDAQLLGGHLQLGLEPWRGKHWSGLVRLELGMAHLSLRGEDASANVRAGRARGFGAQAGLALGPVVRRDGLGVGLFAQAGGARFGGEGLVSSGEPVSLNGAWVGVELVLLWAP